MARWITRHTRWTVYGHRHPMFDTTVISRHRFRFAAQIAAWWFRVWDVGPDAHSWIRAEDITSSWSSDYPRPY